MRNYLLAAVAAAAIASPAVARDGSGYVELDGGVMLAEDLKLDYRDDVEDISNAVTINHNTGFDLGLLGGWDFGFVRAEGELSYKRAGVKDIGFGPGFCSTPENCFADADGSSKPLSAMANLLLDFGEDKGLSGFLGVGIGMAKVKVDADFGDGSANDSDSAAAWQLLAGIRTAVSDNIDLGVKYRYFNTKELKFSDGDVSLRSPWRSHSLLATVTYNFWTPPVVEAPPPPPPPPPPPATQTCPDGSVILATEACPVPPPPPPPAPERG